MVDCAPWHSPSTRICIPVYIRERLAVPTFEGRSDGAPLFRERKNGSKAVHYVERRTQRDETRKTRLSVRACVCILVRYRKDASVLFLWYVSRGEASTFSIVDVQSSASKWTIVFFRRRLPASSLGHEQPAAGCSRTVLTRVPITFSRCSFFFFFRFESGWRVGTNKKKEWFPGQASEFCSKVVGGLLYFGAEC